MQTMTEAPKRRALGKGLESLLPRAQAAAEAAAPEVVRAGRGRFPWTRSTAVPTRRGSRFDEEKLAELAASITASGVVQPILVRPRAEDGSS